MVEFVKKEIVNYLMGALKEMRRGNSYLQEERGITVIDFVIRR